MLEYCEQEGLTFLPWKPLGGSSRVSCLEDIPVITELAQSKGVSVYRIVLAWLRAKSNCVVPIPGASKTASVEDSARAVEVQLSEEEVVRVDHETAA